MCTTALEFVHTLHAGEDDEPAATVVDEWIVLTDATCAAAVLEPPAFAKLIIDRLFKVHDAVHTHSCECTACCDAVVISAADFVSAVARARDASHKSGDWAIRRFMTITLITNLLNAPAEPDVAFEVLRSVDARPRGSGQCAVPAA